MLNKFLPYEEDLFFIINGTYSYFMDNTMWLFSNFKIWIPVAIVFLIVIIYDTSWTKWLPVILAIVIVFTVCDQFSSHLMKPLFERKAATYTLSRYHGISKNNKRIYRRKIWLYLRSCYKRFRFCHVYPVIVKKQILQYYYNYMGCINFLFTGISGSTFHFRYYGRNY